MSYTAYVTVRLNSKRVPKKSIKKIGGSSLVNIAITKLNQITPLNEIILYCSDESVQNYIDEGLNYKFIKRNKKLDGDFITFNEILDTVIDEIKTKYLLFFSVTSPFIKVSTIEDMIDNINSGEFDSSFLAEHVNGFCWYNNQPLNYDPTNVCRTQDLSPVIVENSGLYIFSVDLYKKYKRRIGFNPYIKLVDKVESWDIDTIDDFKIAEIIGKEYGS